MREKSIFELVCGVAGGLTGFLFGAADGLFYALITFTVLDYLTGVAGAAIHKDLSSKVGFGGICKKLMVFVIVALANIIDIQVLGGAHGVLRNTVVAFLLANEGLSILENIGNAGMPVPARLKEVLKQLKEDNRGDKNG
ncbi:MAG: phage holin family protein [Oscillospiraceae bacterium]|nr:phage holin family protein [Oscillospiraceae bacterium]